MSSSQYSKRFQERLENLSFQTDESVLFLEQNTLNIDSKVTVNIELNDKGEILVISYKSISLSDIELVFLDVICHFSDRKKRVDLVNLSIREIENFLRDENHSSALSSEKIPHTFVEDVIKHVMINISKRLFPYNFASEASISWHKAGMVAKIKAAEEFLEAHIRPVLQLDSGDVVLIDVDKSNISVHFLGNCIHCSALESVTLPLIEMSFRTFFKGSEIKMVAK
jgi:Fe-S cluster biogenesis protein NfuA